MILPSVSTWDLIRELQNVTACLRARGLESRGPSSSRSFFQAHSSRSRDSAAETAGEGKGQRRKSRRGYSEVVVEGRLVCAPILRSVTLTRVDSKRSAGTRHGSSLRLYDESFCPSIEFRRSNRGRRQLVPKSRTRLLGLEKRRRFFLRWPSI